MPRKLSEQCKDYITRSLVSPLVLDNRLRTSSNDRSGPLSMKFHKEWRHPDCPVNKWYAQRVGSSTQLKSVQHWRNRKVPYHHEYLLIEFADDAVCRLERVGVGSRSAAIGRVGCTAHDIIQHFPPQTYRNTLLAADPSDLIVELDVEGFDLLDVLAICYGVQQCGRSSTYTVQRFDSHFLCLTVLTILARRIAGWEDRITEGDWNSMVTGMVNKLQNASTNAHDFFGLAISALINNDRPTPRRFILNSIQNRLSTSGRQGLNTKIAATLWHKDLKTAVHSALSNYADGVAHHALSDTDPCATRMKQLLGSREDFDSSGDLRISQFQRAIATQQAATLLNSMQACVTSAMTPYIMRANENAIPWMVLIRSSLHTSGSFLKALQQFGEFREGLISPCITITNARTIMSAIPQVMKITHIRNIKNFMEYGHTDTNHMCDTTRDNCMDSVITATYDMVQQHAAADDYEDRILVVANSWLNEKIWIRCLAVCIGREIGEEVNNMSVLARLAIVQSTEPGQAEVLRQISVIKFFEDIQRRIRTHAGEIEVLGLATATIVQEDIEEAMSEIWGLLRCGFGEEWNIRGPRQPEFDAQLPPYDLEPVEPVNAA